MKLMTELKAWDLLIMESDISEEDVEEEGEKNTAAQ